jgi:hypothetical protein
MQKRASDGKSKVDLRLQHPFGGKILRHQSGVGAKTKILIFCTMLTMHSSSAFAFVHANPPEDRVREISNRISEASLSICESVDSDGSVSPCANEISVVRRSNYNAWSKHGRIFLTSTLVKQSTDDELAFAVAHEMMHCILDHSGSSVKNELEADYWAARLMARSGYDAFAAKSVLARFKINRILSFPFSMFTHPATSRRMKAISGALIEEWVMNTDTTLFRSENVAVGLMESLPQPLIDTPQAFDGTLIASAAQ